MGFKKNFLKKYLHNIFLSTFYTQEGLRIIKKTAFLLEKDCFLVNAKLIYLSEKETLMTAVISFSIVLVS